MKKLLTDVNWCGWIQDPSRDSKTKKYLVRCSGQQKIKLNQCISTFLSSSYMVRVAFPQIGFEMTLISPIFQNK